MDKIEQARRDILYTYRHAWEDPAYVCRFCDQIEGLPHRPACAGIAALGVLAGELLKEPAA